ncbi:MAG TPA: glycosyltransferase [Thermoanaerobaculia bacterium]
MHSVPEILYVALGLRGGGAERLLTNIILKQKDVASITVVSLLPGGVFRRTLEEAGIRVTDLGMHKATDALRGVFALAALIRERRPTLVYGWMYHANLLALFALLLAGRLRTPLVWGIFCTDDHERWPSRLVRRLGAFFSRWVSGVIYNAEEARAFHQRIGFREPRSVVISNCVDPETFRADPRQRDELRTELGIHPDDVVVAIVARVDPMKDWPAMREALRDLPGVITIAVGTGTTDLPPQPGFIGLGWRDDITRILSAADIFLLGSRFGEGTSLALAEAMLCGLPCVVTDVGGNATLTHQCGIVVEPDNVMAMREAIVRLARDPAQRRALGKAAQARASSLFSSSETVRQLQMLTFDVAR